MKRGRSKQLAVLFCLLFCTTIPFSIKANDNLIAQKLFAAGNYAEAAEIFTDPAWKGVALYRSEQWWRAAEAFVRADDAESYYNLGNTYVKLGYYALALEAYIAAQERRKPFEDARFNADLMRQLLSEDEEDSAQSALKRQSEEIDRVESNDTETGGSGNPETAEEGGSESAEDSGAGEFDNRGPTPEASRKGESGDAGNDLSRPDDGSPEGGSIKGKASDPTTDRSPSGGSEGKEKSADAQAAGLRARLEVEQATEQWLNQIKHDPKKFLQRRIELERQRRQAAGESAPEGGSQW